MDRIRVTSVVLVPSLEITFIDETAVHDDSHSMGDLHGRSLIDLDGVIAGSYAEFSLKDRPKVAPRATAHCESKPKALLR